MSHPHPRRPLYLGIREGELAGKPYAAFWNPQMAPLAEPVRQALLHGPVAALLLPRLAEAPRLLAAAEQELEDGFGVQDDGSVHVAVRTLMPGVSPAMIDWWFGWHSAEPQRYKLWHPRAHVHAQWSAPAATTLAGKEGRELYVGRVSLVDEYLGSQLAQAAIRFLPPAELGFDEARLADAEQATVVCAEVGLSAYPVAIGYLVHHVRRLPGGGGAEMRSRFWLGGPYSRIGSSRLLGALVTSVARLVRRPSVDDCRELLVHCAQEMAHLASFLPRLHAELRGVS